MRLRQGLRMLVCRLHANSESLNVPKSSTRGEYDQRNIDAQGDGVWLATCAAQRICDIVRE